MNAVTKILTPELAEGRVRAVYAELAQPNRRAFGEIKDELAALTGNELDPTFRIVGGQKDLAALARQVAESRSRR